MKSIKVIIIMLCIFSMSNVNAQNKKAVEKTEDMIGIFTLEEYSNLHLWFVNQVEDMMLDSKTQADYDGLFSIYTGRIGRAKGKENKDKVLTQDKYIKSIKENIDQLNTSVAPILSSEENKKHLQIMTEFEKILLNKLKLNKK